MCVDIGTPKSCLWDIYCRRLAGGDLMGLTEIRRVDTLRLSNSTPENMPCDESHTGLYRGDVDSYRNTVMGRRSTLGDHPWRSRQARKIHTNHGELCRGKTTLISNVNGP